MFAKFFPETGLPGLLRPGSDMHQGRYARLYQRLYTGRDGKKKLSTGEVIQTLQVLTPTEEVPVVLLLGGHREGSSREGMGSEMGLPSEILSRVAEELKRNAVRPNTRVAGYGLSLYDYFLEILDTRQSLKRRMLERFTTEQKVDRFRKSFQQPRVGVSPIPIQPSKRDFVLLAAGIPPFHYQNRVHRSAEQERGLAIYLDVSGSVNQHLPEIIGLLQSLKRDLKTIFLFSNKVVEVPFKRLLKGHVETTFGTDFDCIAESIVEKMFDKAVIITDGYAGMNEANKETLQERKVNTLTVLFGGRTVCPDFQATGPILRLEEVTA